MTDRATARFVRGLPRTGAVVVVHSADRRREVERAVRAESTATAKLVAVRTVKDRTGAIEQLTGRNVPIVIDGQWRDATPKHLAELVDLLVDTTNLYIGALDLLRDRTVAPR